ncbi:EndonucleaseReverse transcriptase [Phytophthora palmivora]|uniref:EndonucleaseReverse transcriptase n=1 Tax=Phytophthora palmivora TaxID=4796 RepID=A0A2P4YFB4_9STRA|nr:EndonucleaseReverse transcriptase [Phytophthora palmivora]
MSRTFVTIDREKLLEVLRMFLQEDKIRLIRLLMSDTTLSLRVGHQVLQSFDSNTDLANHPAIPSDLLRQIIVYAGDADFICRDPALVPLIQTHTPEVLVHWSLQMIASKTERARLRRSTTPASPDPRARAEE